MTACNMGLQSVKGALVSTEAAVARNNIASMTIRQIITLNVLSLC